MAATFVGTSLNAKILRSTSQNTETNGLVTLEETYTIKTSLAQSIIPRPDTKHSTFSSATTKYPYMFVESTSLKEELGGISTLTVQYSGLLSKTLPRPVIRAIPIESNTEGSSEYLFGNYIGQFKFQGPDGVYAIKTESGPEIQIQFVILSSETYLPRGRITASIGRETLSLASIGLGSYNFDIVSIGSPVPSSINGLPIPFSSAITQDSNSLNMGYVLMNEENFKRGNAIILTQIYRKVVLTAKIAPPPPPQPPDPYDINWWLRPPMEVTGAR